MGLRSARRRCRTAMHATTPQSDMAARPRYMGTALLAFTQEMTNMCYRAMMLVCISQADHMLYTSFLSTSKRDWVEKTQVAQLPRDCMRWGSAWPGEFVKLSGVVLSMIVSFMLFRSEFKAPSVGGISFGLAAAPSSSENVRKRRGSAPEEFAGGRSGGRGPAPSLEPTSPRRCPLPSSALRARTLGEESLCEEADSVSHKPVGGVSLRPSSLCA